MNALVKLEGAVRMLAEAGTLEEVKHVHDLAQAAAEYARAARLGLEAQNSAAEIKLRAERKAGEMLAGLERQPGRRSDITLSTIGQGSEYATVLEETDTTRQAVARGCVQTFVQFGAYGVHRLPFAPGLRYYCEHQHVMGIEHARLAIPLNPWWRRYPLAELPFPLTKRAYRHA